MDNPEAIARADSKSLLRTHRDFLAIGFRHRRLMAISFLGIFLGGIVVALLEPRKYRSHLEILVKQERAEPLITPGPAALPQYPVAETEQQINSEVELLSSTDVLQKVVVACKLYVPRKSSIWTRLFQSLRLRSWEVKARDVRISDAVRALGKTLKVGVVPNTNMVAVSYESPDPNLSAQVLRTLASVYLAKHVSVYRSPGAFHFFQEQANRFERQLDASEEDLVAFNREHGVVSAQSEETAALAQLADFRASLYQTQAQISATRQRIQALEAQAGSTPSRVPTKIVTSKDPLLLENLKSTLLSLQLQRTQLLTKFEPGYPLVRSVDAQITQTRAALAAAEKTDLQQTTTDRDLTYEWGNEELAKAKTDLAGLLAQAAATESTIRDYEKSSQFLSQEAVTQGNLTRVVTTAEGNYLLYRGKEEEARINDALDRRRIVNVAIAEAPTIPSLPSNHRLLTVILAGLLACVVSGGLALGAESMDTTFRTPDEVGFILDIPVIAALPKSTGNGKGNGNGNDPVTSYGP